MKRGPSTSSQSKLRRWKAIEGSRRTGPGSSPGKVDSGPETATKSRDSGAQEVSAGASDVDPRGIPSKSPLGEVASWVGNVAFFDEERS